MRKKTTKDRLGDFVIDTYVHVCMFLVSKESTTGARMSIRETRSSARTFLDESGSMSCPGFEQREFIEEASESLRDLMDRTATRIDLSTIMEEAFPPPEHAFFLTDGDDSEKTLGENGEG